MSDESSMKERIMTAAMELFMASSYNKVSISEIAKKAGVSKGGLFHHFDSKYDLAVKTLFWKLGSELGEFLHSQPDIKPREQLMMLVEYSFELAASNANLARLIFDIYEEAMDKKVDLKLWTDFLEVHMNHIEGCYAKLGAARPKAKALLFMASLDGIWLYQTMMAAEGVPLDMDEIKAEVIDTFIPS